MIVPMEQKHVAQVADLHYRCVKSLLSVLGRRTCRAFYDQALVSRNCFGFVDEECGVVRGFAIGAIDNSCLFVHWRLRLELIRAFIYRPLLLRRVLFHFKGDLAPAPEILYEAVEPAFRRRGIATALTRALCQAFLDRGISHYEVRIDKDNIPNLARHRKLGASVVQEFIEDGISRYLLDKNLVSG